MADLLALAYWATGTEIEHGTLAFGYFYANVTVMLIVAAIVHSGPVAGD